jgi:hypothetical protein
VPTQLISTKSAEHYKWEGPRGNDCDGWHLFKTPELSVIEELPALIQKHHERCRLLRLILRRHIHSVVVRRPRIKNTPRQHMLCYRQVRHALLRLQVRPKNSSAPAAKPHQQQQHHHNLSKFRERFLSIIESIRWLQTTTKRWRLAFGRKRRALALGTIKQLRGLSAPSHSFRNRDHALSASGSAAKIFNVAKGTPMASEPNPATPLGMLYYPSDCSPQLAPPASRHNAEVAKLADALA